MGGKRWQKGGQVDGWEANSREGGVGGMLGGRMGGKGGRERD